MKELLRDNINNEDVKNYNDMILYLQNISETSRTAKLWVENFVQPLFLIMQFVRAECEGDWALHLLVVKGMMPYFFAANHNNDARYGLFYQLL